jgi:phosphoglycolate phosphatase
MPDYQLLIFDWDGTLADSIGRIVEVMHVAAEQLGLPPRSDVAIKGIIGLELVAAIQTLYPQLVTPAQIEGFRDAYSAEFVRREQQASPLFPEVLSGLQRFRAQGYQLAVATGKSRRGLARSLQQHGLSEFFDITRCADEAAGKPDPQMVEEILAHCRVAPERALLIGDAVFDLEMARRAGIAAVGVAYGAQPAEVLRDFGPRLVIEAFADLALWLGDNVVVRSEVGHG